MITFFRYTILQAEKQEKTCEISNSQFYHVYHEQTEPVKPGFTIHEPI
jgi:hypothetical protein